jgi:uncharacterized protein (TIGR02594 family)
VKKPLPKQYQWLLKETGPRLLLEALSHHGTVEWTSGSNPAIIGWAKSTGLAKVYTNDGIPWCSLFMMYVALESGWDINGINLMARSWLKFGTSVQTPMLGDVLVFWRGSKTGTQGHVGIYVGEDKDYYHVLGGNQNDQVSITRIAKTRLLAARRCKWRIAQPSNVRRVILSPVGQVTANEA